MNDFLKPKEKFQKEFRNLYLIFKKYSFNWDKLTEPDNEIYEISNDNSEFTIYNLISKWLNGNQYYSNVLLLLNTLTSTLNRLPESKKFYVEDSFKMFIGSGGHQPLNFVGQILALDYFITGTDFELLSMTAPSENANDTEFILENLQTKSKVLIKVVNIFIDDIEDVSNFESLVIKKIDSDNFRKNRGIESFLEIKNVVVLWATLNKLRALTQTLNDEKNSSKLYDSREVLSWFALKANDSTLLKFGPLTKILSIISK